MSKKALTVLLIEDSSSYAELVQRWLSSVGEETPFVLNWTDSLEAGMTRLGKGGVDVILLDLSLPDCTGIETFTKTRARAPGTPIIVLSAADSESLALETIQGGAEDYLVKSDCNAEGLIRAVRYAVVRHESQISRYSPKLPPVPGRVIGVVGAKGGVGTTTIACTLAAQLREQTDQKVLLADLDVNGGLAAFLVGVDVKYSILDAITNLDRLDNSCWDGMVARGPNDLHVIASPGLMEAKSLRMDSVGQVLKFAQPLYDWTVLDLGRLNAASAALLDPVMDVLVVTTVSVPSLYSAKRLVDGLRDTLNQDRTRLVVNHIESSLSMPRSELDSMFGIPLYANVPYDREELHAACVQRRLPAKGSKVEKEIASLTRRLTGIPGTKRSLRSYLPFKGKDSKPEVQATATLPQAS